MDDAGNHNKTFGRASMYAGQGRATPDLDIAELATTETASHWLTIPNLSASQESGDEF